MEWQQSSYGIMINLIVDDNISTVIVAALLMIWIDG